MFSLKKLYTNIFIFFLKTNLFNICDNNSLKRFIFKIFGKMIHIFLRCL